MFKLGAKKAPSVVEITAPLNADTNVVDAAVAYGNTVTVSTIKRDMVKVHLKRMELDKLMIDLFELSELLPEDVVKAVIAALREGRNLEKTIDLILRAKREERPELKGTREEQTERLYYRAPWVACTLIKDGGPQLRNEIGLNKALLWKFADFFRDLKPGSDEIITTLAARAFSAIFKEHHLKVIDTLCASPQSAAAQKNTQLFAVDLARNVHIYYVAAMLPSFVRIKDPTSHRALHFLKPSKKGVVHLAKCDVYGVLCDQFDAACDFLYKDDKSDSYQTLQEANAAARETQRIELALKALASIWTRICVTMPPPEVQHGQETATFGALTANYRLSLKVLNPFVGPDYFIHMLDRAMSIREEKGISMPLIAVLEAFSSVLALFNSNNLDVDPMEGVDALHSFSKLPLEAQLMTRVQKLVQFLSSPAESGSNLLGRERLALVVVFGRLLRVAGLDLTKELLKLDVLRLMLDLCFEFERNSILHQAVLSVLQYAINSCCGFSDDTATLVLCEFLEPKVNLTNRLVEVVSAHIGETTSVPFYGHACNMMLRLNDLMEDQDEHSAVVVCDDAETKKQFSELAKRVKADKLEETSAQFTRVKSKLIKKKQGEVIRSPVEDDGDSLYYRMVLNEKRKQKENPKFSLFEYLGYDMESTEIEFQERISHMFGGGPQSRKTASLSSEKLSDFTEEALKMDEQQLKRKEEQSFVRKKGAFPTSFSFQAEKDSESVDGGTSTAQRKGAFATSFSFQLEKDSDKKMVESAGSSQPKAPKKGFLGLAKK